MGANTYMERVQVLNNISKARVQYFFRCKVQRLIQGATKQMATLNLFH